MRLNTIGNMFLIFAFLLTAAGIAEPSAATSAVATILLFAGFGILMWESHNTWASGYEAARLDMTFDRAEGRRDEIMWKCGSDSCSCVDDPEYQPILGSDA